MGGPEEEGISQAWASSLRIKGFEPHIGHPSPEVKHKEDKPTWFENQRGFIIEP